MALNIDRILVAGSIMDRISEMRIPPCAIALAALGASPERIKLPGVQQPIVSLPLDAASPDALHAALAQLGFSDIERILPVLVMPPDYTPADAGALRMRLATWVSLEQGTGTLIHASGVPSTELLLAASKIGLLPARLPFSPDDNRHTARWWSMERRPYSIRLATRDDEGELLALDAACWPPALTHTADELSATLKSFKDGQMLLESEDGVMATAHSQRVPSLESLHGTTRHDIVTLHNPDGACFVLTGLSTDADAQSFGWGAQLFDFMLIHASSRQTVHQIAVLAFCKDFTTHSHMPYNDYIQHRDSNGVLIDPILRFHESRGGRIAGVLPGYRPDDLSNERNAVVVTYAPAEVLLRMTRRRNSTEDSDEPPGENAHAIIAHVIQSLMGSSNEVHYDPSKSLQDLGIHSLMLLDLRQRINEVMRCDLDTSFFHDHHCPTDIADYFSPP